MAFQVPATCRDLTHRSIPESTSTSQPMATLHFLSFPSPHHHHHHHTTSPSTPPQLNSPHYHETPILDSPCPIQAETSFILNPQNYLRGLVGVVVVLGIVMTGSIRVMDIFCLAMWQNRIFGGDGGKTVFLDEADLMEGAAYHGDEIAGGGGDDEDVGAGYDVGASVLKGYEVEAVTDEGARGGGWRQSACLR